MVAPGILQNESVKRWLGGLEPAWTLLSYGSFAALLGPPSPKTGAIRLATDLTKDEIEQSAVARMFDPSPRCAVGVGLKLTSTGNLSPAVVAEMSNLSWWPEFARSTALQTSLPQAHPAVR